MAALPALRCPPSFAGVLACAWPYKTFSESNALLFFFYLLLYFWIWFRQTKYIVMMIKEVSTEIVNFITNGAGALVIQGKCINSLKLFFSTSGSEKLSI